jgi:hypothetical protein
MRIANTGSAARLNLECLFMLIEHHVMPGAREEDFAN